MDGVNSSREKALVSLSKSDLVKDYTLIGGTALSMQINARISEDLDFCVWQDRIGEKFKKGENFELLNPKYEVTSLEIRNYIIDQYKEEFENKLYTFLKWNPGNSPN